LYTDIVTTRLPILSAGEDLLKLLPEFSPSLKVFAAEGDSEPSGMDEAAVAEFASRAAARYDRHFNNKENLFLPEREEQLLSLIDYCKKHGLTPVLITTPFSVYYNDPVPEDFLNRFYSTVNRIASDTNVSYYDYSHDARFSDNLTYFSDSDHLNAEGAAYFMEIIAEEVPELRDILHE
ncbi:MAG: SGNH/GDSL hydrolase family protein, partial [Lachnospiraceae bacterium]|nr:SGNH/GDSL hydrolase family protein [Lachnospiraceae bacterium]